MRNFFLLTSFFFHSKKKKKITKVNWLNANVYTIPRYTPSGILGWFTGVGSTQSVIIVLDNWAAKVVGWGPTPVYRAPAVGFTFSWP